MQKQRLANAQRNIDIISVIDQKIKGLKMKQLSNNLLISNSRIQLTIVL
jgi:hypothetical protein